MSPALTTPTLATAALLATLLSLLLSCIPARPIPALIGNIPLPLPATWNNHPDGHGTALISVQQDVITQLSQATTDVVIKRVTTKPLPDINQTITVPVLRKDVFFEARNIRAEKVSVGSNALTLDNGFVRADIKDLVLQIFADFFTDGKSRGTYTIDAKADASGKVLVNTDGAGHLTVAVSEPQVSFTSFDLRKYPSSWIQWIIDAINKVFKRRIRESLANAVESQLQSALPDFLNTVFNQQIFVAGNVSDYAYNFTLSFTGMPIIQPGQAALKVDFGGKLGLFHGKENARVQN
ncbi:hypothetical protein HK102_003746 [Quaeritorhiza haematococci]|nr:hypothetical protein HK102_003746 [Quaeritorhiza haematococci]